MPSLLQQPVYLPKKSNCYGKAARSQSIWDLPGLQINFLYSLKAQEDGINVPIVSALNATGRNAASAKLSRVAGTQFIIKLATTSLQKERGDGLDS